MEPSGGGVARCPVCGSVDEAAARAPLFVVTGASGSGKTAVTVPLARMLAGRAVVFDIDWLIDAATALSGDRPLDWAAVRQAWLAIAHGVAQSGLPTVLLGPLMPEQLEELPARRWVGEIRYLLLDCPDEVRRARIDRRPPWRDHDVAEQVRFARWLRAHIPNRLDTAGCSPAETAESIAAWVRGCGRGG
jgi:predicted ABC-type ATPase